MAATIVSDMTLPETAMTLPETAGGRLAAVVTGMALLGAGCGVFSATEPVPIQVVFRGYSAPASSTVAILTTSDGRRRTDWAGHRARASDILGEFGVRPGDSLHATAQVRDGSGRLIAEARLSRLIQADYDYRVSFQVGGRNPDLGGFCHQSPERTELAGFPTDTLFLWWAGLPRGAVC